MRREELYLADIIEAADAIDHFLAQANKDTFVDDLLRSAVLHKLTVIGEAASHLSKEFRDRHSEIEWADIIGFRNVAVHSYFSVDWNIVWTTATEDVPKLRDQVAKIIDNEFSS
ncbi:MAG: DUF86 domain-containing protein [Chloroflexi bacterium]|nr:DUF86 domain-containing protein [Chloroflexota bacterium]MBI3741490.1 DUF86 domain-containing protein [Chloroflexota bacterium]